MMRQAGCPAAGYVVAAVSTGGPFRPLHFPQSHPHPSRIAAKTSSAGGWTLIYILAALLPPLGLLLNGQPFSAILNVALIVVCVLFGLLFPVLFAVPSAHAIIAVAMKREDRRHREVVEAIRRHGPPPDGRT